MEGYSAVRLFRGTRYAITVRRGAEKGMTVDGAGIEGDVVPLRDAEKCEVVVTI